MSGCLQKPGDELSLPLFSALCSLPFVHVLLALLQDPLVLEGNYQETSHLGMYHYSSW